MADANDEVATMTRTLAAKTGKSLEEWTALAGSSGKTKHGEIVAYLKSTHDLGHGYANFVTHMFLQTGAINAGGDDLITAQYTGTKAPMKAWYDTLADAIQGFGTDVEFAPKKAYVSLRRSKQFGLIQPSTATRMDIGLVLKGTDPSGRLELAGSWNAMCTHRIRLANAGEIDSDLIALLRKAYDQA